MQMHAVGMNAGKSAGEQSLSVPSPRLVSAAHEFEGQMLKELLKPLTESGGLGGSDSGSEILGEFGSEALGKALSEQGGFGIARQIIAQLSRSGNQSDAESVTRNGNFNTGMRRLK
jgi:Rod binding domain-containing protein